MRKIFWGMGALSVIVALTLLWGVRTDRTLTKDKTFTQDRTEDVLSSLAPQKLISATLKIEEIEYRVSLIEGSSAYDLMKKVSQEYDFTFKAKEFPGMGFFIEEINRKKQNPREGMYWIYYINGKKADLGVSNYILKPGDIISWNYEKIQ